MTGVERFAQDQGAGSYGLQAKRAMAAKSGDTGEPPIVGAYRKRRTVQGGSLNFARRKNSVARARVNQSAQKPAVSFRQYDFPPLAMIPPQGK